MKLLITTLLLFSVVFFNITFAFTPDSSADEAVVCLGRIHGIINEGRVKYVQRLVEYGGDDSVGKKSRCKLLVIELDTPGGLLGSTRKIVQSINSSKIPVAVYVTPSGASATSAGTIITLSAHFAAMAPGTNIGAAHPVGGQGEDIKGAMGEKATNDTVAFIKSQAELRKRNIEWAEQAIRKSVSATATEAVEKQIVDFVARDLDELLAKISKTDGPNLDSAHVVVIEPTVGERVLTFLGDPNVSYLLMVVGGLGVYIELTSPGAILPGVLGAISVVLSFLSLSTLPVNYGALVLLVLGIAFLIAEAFITSYGVLTIGGLVSLVLGALFLIDESTGDLKISLSLVVPTVIAMASITGFIAYLLIRSKATVYKGLSDLTGMTGLVEAVSSNGKSGKCFCHGEIWNFQLEKNSAAVLKVGDKVKVVNRNGLKLEVKPSEEKDLENV